jgi:hypothetical protein
MGSVHRFTAKVVDIRQLTHDVQRDWSRVCGLRASGPGNVRSSHSHRLSSECYLVNCLNSIYKSGPDGEPSVLDKPTVEMVSLGG